MHPSFREAARLLDQFHGLIAEGFTPPGSLHLPERPALRRELFRVELAEACGRSGASEERAQSAAAALLETLPELREQLAADVRAALDNDPAAASAEEVEACYPGFRAVVAYRLAHRIREAGIRVLPRMISEFAHSHTGIDIHPGAEIGSAFFIDHGTGVVIGETTRIGDSVTLYQGVTLGALNFPRDPSGKILRVEKRHPTIEDQVVIYSHATILGGDTVIGRASVIGANVWLTESIDPGTVVLQKTPTLQRREGRPSRSPTPPQ